MTEGQHLAIEQLEEIECASDGLLEIISCNEQNGGLIVFISVDCSGFSHAEGGIHFRLRESFRIDIPATFPFDNPSIRTTHTRWAGQPHVNWGSHLCLYQSPTTEWDSNDGLYGFFQRLDFWLHQAAGGKLIPTGQPLHPPAKRAEINSICISASSPKPPSYCSRSSWTPPE